MTIKPFSYPRYRFPAEIISHAVWLYHVFSLSLRDVSPILAERGIVVTHESIRDWCQKFGADFARRLRLRRRAIPPSACGRRAPDAGGIRRPPQVAVLRIVCRPHRWLAGAGGARLPARPYRACDAAQVRLCASMEAMGPGETEACECSTLTEAAWRRGWCFFLARVRHPAIRPADTAMRRRTLGLL
jgi:putative transposase